MWSSYSSVLAGSAIPRHSGLSHPGLCQTPCAPQNEQMGASSTAGDEQQPLCSCSCPGHLSLLLRGGRLRGPTFGCFGHRIFPFADMFSQSPNKLVAVCREKLRRKISFIPLSETWGKIVLYTSEPSCLVKTRNEMSSWKTNCPVCFMHEPQHS